MPRGPKMPDDVRGWITRQAQENPKWGTKKIRAEMVDWLEKRHPNYPVSGLDAVRKAVSTARGVKSSLDDPWSLGACEEHTILHDATADLLAIWKRSIIGGAKFTIRQAIWAARLKHAVSGTPTRSRLEELRHWAVAYAADARVAEALGETLDTSFLDSNLAFRNDDGSFSWGHWWLASSMGAVPRFSGRTDMVDTLAKKMGVDQARELLFERGLEVDSDEVQELRKMIRSCATELLTETAIGQHWEDTLILLLRKISTTARWQTMSGEDREKVVQRLVEPSPKMFDERLEDLGFKGIFSKRLDDEGASG